MAAAKRSYWVAGLLAVMGLALAAAIAVQALSALGFGTPGPSDQARAAATMFTQANSESDYRAVETKAREVLDRAPLEARMVSLIALVRRHDDPGADVTPLIRAAAAISNRDAVADLWLFEEAMERGRYEDALARADALLRREAGGNRQVVGALVYLARAPEALRPLAARLAADPIWRPAFFSAAIRRPVPPFVYPLFEAMRAAGGPPTAGEMEALLRALVQSKEYERAYLTWLLSLDGADLDDLGYVYDGGFTGRPTIAPFGWAFPTAAAGRAVITGAPNARALLVDLNGYASGVVASQLMVLPPGRYGLSLKVRGDGGAGQLAWRVSCEPSKTALLDLPAAPSGDEWAAISGGFTIPADGCQAQILSLRSNASASPTQVTAWYDDVAIEQAAP